MGDERKEKKATLSERQRCLAIVRRWQLQGTPVMQWTAMMIAAAIQAKPRETD